MVDHGAQGERIGLVHQRLVAHLEMEGFHVDQIGDYGAAIAAIATEQPDLILLDLTLPSGDGLDILTRLRRNSDVPVILLTARGSEAAQQRVLRFDGLVLDLGIRRIRRRIEPYPGHPRWIKTVRGVGYRFDP